MKDNTAGYWIEHLQLIPHPEGGYYKETFRSGQEVRRSVGAAIKSACTSIHYLLEADDFSAFHRLASDELWYFHSGDPLWIYVISHSGEVVKQELSNGINGKLSLAIEPGLWFAACVSTGGSYSLVSCAVAPGFDFQEFEIADKQKMLALYSSHAALIDRLCR